MQQVPVFRIVRDGRFDEIVAQEDSTFQHNILVKGQVEGPPLVGAWTQRSSIDYGNVTYHVDGTFEKHVTAALGQALAPTPTFQTIQSGIWRQTGPLTYDVVYTSTLSVPTPVTVLPTVPTYRLRNSGTITLNDEGTEATGTGTVSIYLITDLCLETPVQVLPNINSTYCRLQFD